MRFKTCQIKHQIKHMAKIGAGALALALISTAGHAGTVSIPDYLIIATGAGSEGIILDLQDSELGAISAESGGLRFNAVSPPQGNPAFPATTPSGATVRGPQTGVITLDGDAAITDSTGTATISNSDIHAINTGPDNPGSQGIDCRNSFNGCTDNGTQANTGTAFGAGGSSNGFNQTGLPGGPSFSALDENNGVQGGVSELDQLVTDLTTFRAFIEGSAQTLELTITSAIQTDFILTFGSGLHIVDIVTNGTDFSLDTANFIIEGLADTQVIFRLEDGATLGSSNGNFLLAGDIGLNSVLFFVDADDGEESFNFSNTEFFGYTFFDFLGQGTGSVPAFNVASFNNVRGCGQVITDQVVYNNVSQTGCAFSLDPPPEIPVPAAFPLFMSALVAFRFVKRRRKVAVPG